MADGIPRDAWSDSETHAERLYYWEYLLERWLVPESSAVAETTLDMPERRVASPSRRALSSYGWLKEPENVLEQ